MGKVKTELFNDDYDFNIFDTFGDNDMPLTPPVTKTAEGVTEGTHIAVCNMIAYLGHRETKFGKKEQVYIRFEVPGERYTYTDDNNQEVDQPKFIGSSYTFSFSSKATLRKMVESWRGKSFTDEELGDSSFDITKLLGKACQLAVTKTDKGTSVIKSVIGLPAGMEAPELQTAELMYDGSNRADLATMPKWIQECHGYDPEKPGTNTNTGVDEDVPF